MANEKTLAKALKELKLNGNQLCAPNKIVSRLIHSSAERFKKGKSGIIEDNNSLESKGLVVLVGSEIDWIKPGDVVHHGQHSGTIIPYKGEALLTMDVYQINLIDQDDFEYDKLRIGQKTALNNED